MRIYSIMAGVLLGLGLCFGGAQAQEIEHLSLPVPSVTDRALPPAKDGGIYLPLGAGASKSKVGKTKEAVLKKKSKATLKADAKTKGKSLKAKSAKRGKDAKAAPAKKKAKAKAKKK